MQEYLRERRSHAFPPHYTPVNAIYCLNCTKFGKLILRKIIKIVATRCHILKLKCTQFDFGWGSAPDPVGELTALRQAPELDIRGLLLTEGRGRRTEGKGKGGRGGDLLLRRGEG